MVQIREHDWKAAGEFYQKAIGEWDNINAMATYALFYLQHIGKQESAVQIFAEVSKRDPFHAGYKANLANLYTWNGKAEAAVIKAREALDLEPQHQFALMALIDAYTAVGNHVAVQGLLEKLPLADQGHPRIRARIGLNYLSQGEQEKAREIYKELLDLDLDRLSQGFAVTTTLAVNLGEIEKAIDLMEAAVERNIWNQFWTASLLRQNDALKEHPRYLAHLKRMKLDDASIAELHKTENFDHGFPVGGGRVFGSETSLE